jgi:hypothetical protein
MTLNRASEKNITKLWAGLSWFSQCSVGLLVFREHGDVISNSINNLKLSGKYIYRLL